MTRLHLSTPDNPPEFGIGPLASGPAQEPRDPAPSRLVVAILSAGMAALITVWLMAPADPIECALMQAGVAE